MEDVSMPNREDLVNDLEKVFNYHSTDNAMGMPDFLLADLVVSYLEAQRYANRRNEAIKADSRNYVSDFTQERLV